MRKWGLDKVHIRTWVSQTKDRKQSRHKKLSANKPSKESLSKKTAWTINKCFQMFNFFVFIKRRE